MKKSLWIVGSLCILGLLLVGCEPIDVDININNGGSWAVGGELTGVVSVTGESTGDVQFPQDDAATVEMSDEVIELAILLDTSNSMDGLIEQAKSQLRQMVNEFSKARDTNGRMPRLKLALYEYGNDDLSMMKGYIRQVTPFTQDLDLISQELWSLDTNGGSEYCGEVIKKSVADLDRSGGDDSLKIILIAGNEEFTQGDIDYRQWVADAKAKGIIVNTIFCGDYDEGVDTMRKDGATLGGGKYFNIDQDKEVVYIDAPQDDLIFELNQQLNDTYIPYGSEGEVRAAVQEEQDEASSSYGLSNLVNRAVTKSSKNYSNASWDLIDAIDQNIVKLDDVDEKDLPQEMQDMTLEEREKFVVEQQAARDEIQTQISELSIARDTYIAEERSKMNLSDDTLDQVMLDIISSQLGLKGFVVE